MTENIAEEWRDIPNHDNYQASNLGNIRKGSKILKKHINTHGYEAVNICVDRKWKYIRVHRLVMLSFIGHSELDVDHINGIKSDNRLSNLEYVTERENVYRFYKKTSAHPGVEHYTDRPRKKPFRARIRKNGKLKGLGWFETSEEASSAYLEASKI